jgi:hypothetical protein
MLCISVKCLNSCMDSSDFDCVTLTYTWPLNCNEIDGHQVENPLQILMLESSIVYIVCNGIKSTWNVYIVNIAAKTLTHKICSITRVFSILTPLTSTDILCERKKFQHLIAHVFRYFFPPFIRFIIYYTRWNIRNFSRKKACLVHVTCRNKALHSDSQPSKHIIFSQSNEPEYFLSSVSGSSRILIWQQYNLFIVKKNIYIEEIFQ